LSPARSLRERRIFIATRDGKSDPFKEENVREMGRNASGVRGINLAKNDEVIAVEIVDPKATRSP